MANISETQGTLELIGNWEEKERVLFAYLYKTQEGVGDYCFWDSTSVGELVKQFKKAYDFLATGRWSFETNLINFKEWCLLTKDKNPDVEKWINDLIHIMREKDLTIDFKYYDCDVSYGWLCFIEGYLDFNLIWHTKKVVDYNLNIVSYAKTFYGDGGELFYIEEELELIFDKTEYDLKGMALDIFNHPTGYDLLPNLEFDNFDEMGLSFHHKYKKKK